MAHSASLSFMRHIFLLAFLFSYGRCKCGRFVNKDNFSMSCTSSSPNFVWTRTIKGHSITLSFCNKPDYCFNHFPENYNIDMQKSVGGYVSTFTIYNITKESWDAEATWKCLSGLDASVYLTCIPILEQLPLDNALPRAILHDCPAGQKVRDGYILWGTHATCICTLTYQNNRPGQIQWYDYEGKKIGKNVAQGGRSATLEIPSPPMKRIDKVLHYTCRATGNTNLSSELHFRPTFTYGPGKMDVKTWFGFCVKNSTRDLHIDVQVNAQECFPSPVFNITIARKGTLPEQNHSGKFKESFQNYTHHSVFKVTQESDVDIVIQVRNHIFPHVSIEKRLHINVPEFVKPELPIITKDDNTVTSSISVKPDAILNLECKVKDNKRRVVYLKFGCDDDSSPLAKTNNSIAVTVSLRRNTSLLNCSCSVKYDDECSTTVSSNILITVDAMEYFDAAPYIAIGVTCSILFILSALGILLFKVNGMTTKCCHLQKFVLDLQGISNDHSNFETEESQPNNPQLLTIQTQTSTEPPSDQHPETHPYNKRSHTPVPFEPEEEEALQTDGDRSPIVNNEETLNRTNPPSEPVRIIHLTGCSGVVVGEGGKIFQSPSPASSTGSAALSFLSSTPSLDIPQACF